MTDTNDSNISFGTDAQLDKLTDDINVAINVAMYGSPTDPHPDRYNGGMIPDEWKSKEALEKWLANTKPEYATSKSSRTYLYNGYWHIYYIRRHGNHDHGC